MKFFNFDRLITKYSSEFVLKTPSKGSYVGGHYQHQGETETTLTGAIMAISATKIYQSGGYLRKEDKYLYTLQPLEGALDGCKVLFDGVEYSVEEDTQKGNARYTGVYVYILRWVNDL